MDKMITYDPPWTIGNWKVEKDYEVDRDINGHPRGSPFLSGYNIVTDTGDDICGDQGIIPGGKSAYDARLMAAGPALVEAVYNVTSLLKALTHNTGDEVIITAVNEADKVLKHVMEHNLENES